MTLELDLHGLTPSIAIQRIQRFIVENPQCDCIEIIHGYNKGKKLKFVLEDKNNRHNKRVIKTLPVPFNAGRTFIFLNSKNS